MNLRPLLALPLVLWADALSGQVADEGTLRILSHGQEVGSETFRVTTGDQGLRIVAKATYPAARPPLELTASLDRTQGSDELAFQLEHRGGAAGSQVYAVRKGNRLTIRRVERGGEQASEAPGAGNLVFLADSVFSLYLQILPQATEPSRSFSAVLPPAARRIMVTAQRQPTPAGGALIRLSGGVSGEITLGNHGELLRVSLPTLGLEAVRRQE